MMRKKSHGTAQRNPRQAGERPKADVFSYHSNRARSDASYERDPVDIRKNGKGRSVLSTEGSRTLSSRHRYRYLPSLIAVFIIFASFAYSTVLSTNPQVVPLSDTSPSLLRPNEEYEAGISEVLTQKPANRSKLTIQTNDIEKEIVKKFPELASVSVNIPLLGKRPVVQISPAEPTLILRTQSGDYVLDNRGTLLMSMADLPNKEQFRLVTVNDLITPTTSAGQRALPESTIKFINDLVFQFQRSGREVELVELPALANELHLRLKDTPHYLKFNLQNDALVQSGSYFALIDSGVQPREYVDLRVDGRAYYK